MNAEAEPFMPSEEPNEKDKDGEAEAAEGKAEPPTEQEFRTAGMSGTPLWRPQYQGRIRSYSQQKGFGFIDCAESLRAFGRDVFIHRFQMAEFGLSIGQSVVFEVELNKTGCPQARNVKPANDQVDPRGAMGMGMGMGMGIGHFNMGFGGQQMGGMGAGMGNMGGKGGGLCGGGKGGPGKGSARGGQHAGQPDQIEEMLRHCEGSARMWEIIEQHGHSFSKNHVVTALYQLGLCRQYERRDPQANLTIALVDCLVLYDPREFSPDESSRVLWALAILEELHDHNITRGFAMKLGEEAAKRCHEFTPDKMAKLVSSLSRLVKSSEEDELVGRLTTGFSDYALGQGSMPRFPPEELRTWMSFLREVSAGGGGPPHGPPSGPFAGPPQGLPPMKGAPFGPGPMGGYSPQMPGRGGPGGPWPGKGGCIGGPAGPGGGPGIPGGGMGPGSYSMQGKGGGFLGPGGGGPGGYAVGGPGGGPMPGKGPPFGGPGKGAPLRGPPGDKGGPPTGPGGR